MHVIRSAYKCSDEDVLDMRIGRLVQMIGVLNAADDVRRLEIEWQTKVVASVVANTIEDNKARTQLLKKITAMNIRGVDESGPGTPSADTPADGRSVEEVIEQGSVAQALAKNLRRKSGGLFPGMG